MNNFKIVGLGKVEIGMLCQIDAQAQIVFNKPGRVRLGDYCTIGPGVKIVCNGGDVSIGDWTTLHDNCLVLSTQYVHIGEHCWFGQNCVLDGSGGLKIGRGVRVGMYSQIWSHVAAGEQIEGCTLIGERAVTIEDDVWLVGTCIVASGLTIGRRTVALIGSNITKTWPENSVLAGTPASSKPNLSFYRSISLPEKWEMLSAWLFDAAANLDISVTRLGPHEIVITAPNTTNEMRFILHSEAATVARDSHPQSTVCCIEDKTYTKQLNGLEKQVLKYLSGNKARFTPV